jgi:hypothetical protein
VGCGPSIEGGVDSRSKFCLFLCLVARKEAEHGRSVGETVGHRPSVRLPKVLQNLSRSILPAWPVYERRERARAPGLARELVTVQRVRSQARPCSASLRVVGHPLAEIFQLIGNKQLDQV